MARFDHLPEMDLPKFKAQHRDIRTRKLVAKLGNQRLRKANSLCDIQPKISQSGIDVNADTPVI